MKRKIKRGDRPVGKLKKIDDFLPPPEELAAVEEKVKVTLFLDRWSLEFFKLMAGKLGAKYQGMMREVLKGYAQKYAAKRC